MCFVFLIQQFIKVSRIDTAHPLEHCGNYSQIGELEKKSQVIRIKQLDEILNTFLKHYYKIYHTHQMCI